MPTFAEDLLGFTARGWILNSWGPECLGGLMSITRVTPAATAQNTTARYYPLTISEPFTLVQFGWVNGGTLGSTIDVGLYDQFGNRLSHGSAAQSGATALQQVGVSNLLLPPDNYYLASTANNTTGRILSIGVSASNELDISGAAVQASQTTLPATAAFTRDVQTNTQVPLIIMFAA